MDLLGDWNKALKWRKQHLHGVLISPINQSDHLEMKRNDLVTHHHNIYKELKSEKY